MDISFGFCPVNVCFLSFAGAGRRCFFWYGLYSKHRGYPTKDGKTKKSLYSERIVGRIQHKNGILNKIRKPIPRPIVWTGFPDSIPIIMVRKKPMNTQQIRNPRDEFHESDRLIFWLQDEH